MDSRFSLCLCHPRSQPARSDKRIPTRASRTSFTVCCFTVFTDDSSKCRHLQRASQKHGTQLCGPRLQIGVVAKRPFPFLSGVILDPAFDRRLPMRTGHRRAGRGRHRDVQNAVRVELYMAAPVLKSLNPVCYRPPPIYASWLPPWRTVPSSSLHGCRSSRAVRRCASLGIKLCSKPEYCLCRLYTVDAARWLCRLERHQGYTYTL
ncbi:uncharacterized protein LOC144142983 [Haemaphysalis longicornis]